MKKKILSAILSFAMLFSVVASVGSITASAAISDGIVWEQVFEELMTENPAGDGTGPVENSYKLNGYPDDSTWISGDPGRTGSEFTNYSEEYGFTDQALRTNGAELIVEASPLYNSEDNTKVRIEFGFASKEGSNLKANINLVGSVDGETKTTSTSTATERFVFMSGGKFYYDNPEDRIEGMSFSTSTCYKITIDIDCITDTYDVYINGELQETGVGLAYDFDAIYGVGFSASAKAFYVDDIRYYTAESTGTVVKSNVTLNVNGGTINSGNVVEYTEGIVTKLPADVTKAGCKFLGWYDNADFTGDAVEKISAEAIGDLEFYAKWVTVYSVTLNADGGSINGNITEYAEGEDVTLPTATKAGYTFLGWYDNAELTGDKVEEVIAPTGNLEFYAKWEKLASIGDGVEWEKIFEEAMDEYPDQFDSGKGSVENYYEIGGYPSDTSWITTAAASFDKSAVSEYSGWSLRLGAPKNNAVRYADMILEESPLYNNPNNKKVRVEFEFATDKDAGMYVILEGEKDGEHVRTTAGDSGRFIFTSNGCLNFETAIKGYTKNYMHKMVIDLDCETQKYDVYLDGSMVAYSQDFPMAMDRIYGVSFAAKGSSSASTLVFLENLRYYTQKVDSVETYNVTLNANGGTIEDEIAEYSKELGAILPKKVTKTGFEFGGWYENADFSGSVVTAIPSGTTGDKTYYAKWLAICSVNYETNGGTIDSGNVAQYVETKGATLPTDVKRAGYKFLGWYDNAEFTGDAVTEIPTTATGDKTYYAKWVIVYKVTLEGNGGVVYSDNVTEYEDGVGATLPTDVKRAGYKFLGWYDNESLTGDVVTEIPATAKEEKTFYAKWERLPFMSDNLEWEKIFEEKMEEYPDQIDSGKGPVDQLYDIEGYPDDVSWISGAAKTWTNSDGTQALRIGGPMAGEPRHASLKVEKSPLYNNTKNTKVRVEFDIATNQAAGAYIILVGEKDGEVVQTTAGDSGRFIFTSNNCFNFETAIKGYTKDYWHNMVIDLDCETQKYDVYLDGNIVAHNEDFPMAMDKVYGVSFASKGSSDFSTHVYIDNLRYYTVLPEGLEISIDEVISDGVEVLCDVTVLGYVSEKENLKATIAVYGEDNKMLGLFLVDYKYDKDKKKFSFGIQEEIEGLDEGAYVKVFVWNITNANPICTNAYEEISFE